LNNFFSELKRRNVVKVAIAYAVVAWAVLQFVDIIQDPLSLPDWFQKVVIVLVAIGFPIALVISWAFEVTPEGVKKTAEVDKSKSITHGTGQRINKLIIGGLVLAVVFLLADKFYLKTGQPDNVISEARAGQVSIAVLPFADMSAGQDQEFFADGISEEILNVLAQAKDLKVTSRSSAFSMKGMNLDVPTMGARLGVDYLLEGSVRKSAGRVRITAQLIDVHSDSHLWSNTYDRDISDVFKVQDEIAGAIAEALQIQFGGGAGPVVTAPTENREAHEEYLKGRFYWNKRGIDNLYIAKDHYEKAIGFDPGYALAYLGLAETLVLIPDYNPVFTDQRDVYLASERNARKALALDPTLGQAHTTLGYVLYELDRWGEALTEMKKSVDLAPDYATGWQWFGNTVGMMGDLQKSERLQAKAKELDPLSKIILSNYIDALISTGKNDQAEKEIRAALNLFPDFSLFYASLGNMELQNGNFGKARDSLSKAAALQGGDAEVTLGWLELIETYRKTGKPAPVPPNLLESVKNLDFYSSGPDLVYMAGRHDLAFEELSGLLALTGPRYLVFYNIWWPSYAPLRRDPQFKTVMREAGFVDLWNEYRWPDKCRPLTGDDFECE